MTKLFTRCVFGALSALLPCVGVASQVTPWTPLPVPGGVVAANLRQIGKIITYYDGSAVQAYSAFAHRWVPQAVSASATVRVANDLALVVDGNIYHAFSSYLGTWSSVALSANATVVNPAAQQNDSIWLVRDGNTMWTYTAFRGQWRSFTVSGAATAQLERHVAVLVDGTSLHAMSAIDGNWVSTSAPAQPTIFRARGTAAVAASSSAVHGFSALTNSWTAGAAIGAAPTLTVNDDVQIVRSGTTHLGFSGLRGSFAAITLPTVTYTTGETVAYATDGVGQQWVYSAVRGSWTTLPTGTPVNVSVGSNAVIVEFGDRVHAYSAMTGTVATVLATPSITALGRATGSLVAQDGSVQFYSAMLGQWFAAPPGATTPELSDVAGFARIGNGIAAFSARSGRFNTLTLAGPASTTLAVGNAVQGVTETNAFHVFDPRRERWLSAPLQSIPTIGTHRTTYVVVDGTTAYGYGAFTGRLTPVTLPAPGSILRPNSESASIETPNAIYAHSSVPDILSLWQFPEFRRVYTTGTPMELQVQGIDGSGVFFLGLRVLAAPLPLGTLGDLELDTNNLVLAIQTPVPISQGHGAIRFPVPDDPALRGLEFSFQAVVVPSSAPPYLTGSTSVTAY